MAMTSARKKSYNKNWFLMIASHMKITFLLPHGRAFVFVCLLIYLSLLLLAFAIFDR